MPKNVPNATVGSLLKKSRIEMGTQPSRAHGKSRWERTAARRRFFRRRSKVGGATSTRFCCAQCDRYLHFFKEFFKSRIATQRIPKRHQFQLAIAEVAWVADCDGELFAGEIFIADPCSDHREKLDHG